MKYFDIIISLMHHFWTNCLLLPTEMLQGYCYQIGSYVVPNYFTIRESPFNFIRITIACPYLAHILTNDMHIYLGSINTPRGH